MTPELDAQGLTRVDRRREPDIERLQVCRRLLAILLNDGPAGHRISAQAMQDRLGGPRAPRDNGISLDGGEVTAQTVDERRTPRCRQIDRGVCGLPRGVVGLRGLCEWTGGCRLRAA